MSKFHVNTKSATYIRDKENFIKELKQFHESKNSPPFKIPVLNGKEVDLYLFHLMIFQRGGWSKITNQGALEQLLRALQLPVNCLNIEALLKCIYIRYLERYERSKNTQGREDDFSADVEDDYRRSRGPVRAVQTYTSAESHASRNLPRVAGPSERLALSLLSPLPNEQDFALNVCTVLAAESANRLPLASTPHILDFLLAHAGVYNHPTLRDIVGHCYQDTRGLSPDNFWSIRARGGGAFELSDENRWLTSNPDLSIQAMASQITLGDKLVEALQGDDYIEKKMIEIALERDKHQSDEWWLPAPPDEETLFASKIEGGARDVITQRILQVTTIARNISFHEENIPFLAKHQTYLRFLLLASNCWMGGLKQSAMDALGNISQELVVKDPATCLLTRHLFSSILAALQSDDRARIISGLEILNKLAQNELNEDILLKCLEQKMYHQVCSFLTINDIMLLVATLECVYALTSLGERASDYVVRVKGLVDTLVSLITVEAQSYGPKACILMRVVETVAGNTAIGMAPTGVPLPVPMETHSHSPVKGSKAVAAVPTPQPIVPMQDRQHNVTQPTVLQQTTVVPQRPQEESNSSSSSSQSATPTSSSKPGLLEPKSPALTVQQQHAHQQAIQENEQFALMWLRNCWEPCHAPTPSTVEAAELYRQYLACCSKVGRKGVIAPLHFPRCVRSVFGGMVGPNGIKSSSGEMQQHYVGIKMRAGATSMMPKATPTPPTVKPSGPSSPILKAQLSKLEMSKQQQQSTNHPHLSQALTDAPAPAVPTVLSSAQAMPNPTTSASAQVTQTTPSSTSNNTSMIKHLLAHKVEHPNIARNPQVAQRQNQQRMLGQQTNPVPVQIQRMSPTNIEDPEALISCSTITSTGVTSTSPLPPTQTMKSSPVIVQTSTINAHLEDALDGMKKEHIEEHVPHNNTMQQNKMLADLLEKKSTPPMTNIQNQLPETSQLKNLNTEEIEVNMVSQMDIQEPPVKKLKTEGDRSQEIVSTTAANLYAALAASALEDEEDLLINQQSAQSQNVQIQEANQIRTASAQLQQVRLQQPSAIMQQTGVSQPSNIHIQQSNFSLQQSSMHIQQPVSQPQQIVSHSQPSNIHIHHTQMQSNNNMQVQPSSIQVHQIQQSNVIKQTNIHMQAQQVQQPSVQVQQVQQSGMQVQQQNMLMQQQSIQLQQPGLQMQVQQQPMQVVQVQQPTLQVQPGSMQVQVQQIQQALQQQPIQVQIQQPSMQMQVQQANVQMDMQLQQIAGPAGQIILQEKQVLQGPQYISQQPMQIIATPNSQQSNLGYLPSGVVPHKTIIILQGSAHNTPITLTQNPTNVIQTQQRIIQSTPTVIQSQPTIVTSQTMIQPQNIMHTTGVIKQQIIQSQSQLANNQKPAITHQSQPQKPQQIVMGNQQIASMVSSSNQHVIVNQAQPQMVMAMGNQTIVTQSQQVITMDGKQIMVNRQITQPTSQATQVRPNQATTTQALIQNQINQNIQQNMLPAGRPVLNKQQTVIGIQKMPVEKTVQSVNGANVIVKKNEQPAETQPVKAELPPTQHLDNPWMCQWRSCNRAFDTAGAVFAHAARAHCPPVTPPNIPAPDTPCQWYGCDKMPRKRFALMTHLQDRHCTAEALRTAHAARRRAATQPITQVTQNPSPNDLDSDSTGSVGYAPNAALHALNRHAVDFLNPRELMDDNEGPVTKSIRLTAALILRNIVIYSNIGRRQLRSYEPHLASIALSSVEASRTVAQILYDMNNI